MLSAHAFGHPKGVMHQWPSVEWCADGFTTRGEGPLACLVVFGLLRVSVSQLLARLTDRPTRC